MACQTPPSLQVTRKAVKSFLNQCRTYGERNALQADIRKINTHITTHGPAYVLENLPQLKKSVQGASPLRVLHVFCVYSPQDLGWPWGSKPTPGLHGIPPATRYGRRLH